MHTKKKNTNVLVIASQEIGLEVHAEGSKYMFMYRDQDTGQNSNRKISIKSFERMEQFQYLGTAIMNQNSIHEEIKSGVGECMLLFGVNRLSSSLLSKNINKNYNFACCF
jgi:hypothetical protein